MWVGKWIKQIVGQASFVMNACTCFTQFSYIVSHYRHQPTSSSWLCEVEWLYHRILLYTETTINHHTVNHNDLMILYLLILNPIVTSLKPKLFSDIYRACLIMNRRAASYRMLMMICCCCWGGTGCKPPAPRGSETGVSCTACILMKLHIVNESRIWMQTKMRLNPTDLPLIAPMKQCANWYQDDVDRYDNSSRFEHQQLYRQSDLHSFRCSVCI